MTDQPDSYYTVQPGDTFHSLAQLCYHDRNKWMRIRQVNLMLRSFGPDQPLPVGLQLTLPFIPELTTAIITEEGDTLRSLAKFFYFFEDQWLRIGEANTTLQGFGPDQPLPVGLQLTLPFIPERTIILITNQGDTLHTLAKIYYDDENQWVRIGKVTLQGLGPDQPLPVGLQLTLPSFMAITVIITEKGDTLRSLGQAYYHTEDHWLKIRQINTPLQGFSPDQPLPVGLQLELPSLQSLHRLITTGSNNTFISLAQTFYQNANKWPTIRQANRSLQHYNSDQTLPAGIRVTIP